MNASNFSQMYYEARDFVINAIQKWYENYISLLKT